MYKNNKTKRIEWLKNELFIFQNKNLDTIRRELTNHAQDICTTTTQQNWIREYIKKIRMIDEYILLTGKNTI